MARSPTPVRRASATSTPTSELPLSGAPDPDQDFDDLYRRILAPALAPHEAERRRLLRQAILVTLAAFAVFSAIAAIAALHWRHPGPLMAAAVLTGVAWTIASGPLTRLGRQCKAEALGRLSAALGLTYTEDGFEPEGVPRLQTLGLLPGFDRSSYEDHFSGRRQGCDFSLYEANFEQRRSTGKSTHYVCVFRGQIIHVRFPERFSGATVVQRHHLFAWRREGFQPVGLVSSQFEKIFDVYGTDQVEARALVHPAFMERLMALEAALGGEKLRCAFDEGELLIVVEGGDLFEIVDVYKPMPDQQVTRKGVEGIAHVLKLIDAVLAPPPNPYAEPAS